MSTKHIISDITPPRRPSRPVSYTRRSSHYQPQRRTTAGQPIDGITPARKPAPSAHSSEAITPHTTVVKPQTVEKPSKTTHKKTDQEAGGSYAESPKEKSQDNLLTISEHLEEFRKRLIISIVALFIGGALGYVYRDYILAVLIKPLNQQLYYTSPAGGFDFLVKVCVFVGFLFAIPILVYQLLKFLSPAVPTHVTYKTSRVLLASVLLAIMGACFAYFVSLPAALHFLNNFSEGPVNSLITANEYFNFVMIYVVGFAALFQMPLILLFINKITPLSPKKLMKNQRFVILGSFVIAAFLTPTPDPFNQALMAAPMIALYQSSIGVVWSSNKRTKKKEKKKQRNANLYAATA